MRSILVLRAAVLTAAVLTALLILTFTSASYAIGNIYIDGIGAFTQTMDAKNQFGGGGSLLYQVDDSFNIFVKNIYTFRKIAARTDIGESYFKKYDYFLSTAGVEYLFNINKWPLFWKNAAGIGIGKASIRKNYDSIKRKYLVDEDDTGLALAVWTGLLYVFTQNISAYADVGFHKTYFSDELKNNDIMGFQALVGVRITVWGMNRSIYSEY